MEAFSYEENTLYQGRATKELMDRFLPGSPDPRTAWAFLRGYPALPDDWAVSEVKHDRFLVLSETESPGRWVVVGGPAGRDPAEVVFTETGFKASFQGFTEEDGKAYAQEVDMRVPGRGGVRFRNEKMAFNRRIPDAVFELRPPRAHRTVDLST